QGQFVRPPYRPIRDFRVDRTRYPESVFVKKILAPIQNVSCRKIRNVRWRAFPRVPSVFSNKKVRGILWSFPLAEVISLLSAESHEGLIQEASPVPRDNADQSAARGNKN